jgi:hypothetical protein
MKKVLVIVAIVGLTLSLGAVRASAQGPQGAGAGAAAAETSHSSHSYNPIHWVKKSPKTSGDQLDANSDQNRKLTAALQAQGVLAANASVKDACTTFRELGDCVAALHVSHKLGLDFNCLKSNLTGVQTSADMSTCKGEAGNKVMSLTKAIHAMKPEVNAKAEAKSAEKQAKDDLKEAGA